MAYYLQLKELPSNYFKDVTIFEGFKITNNVRIGDATKYDSYKSAKNDIAKYNLKDSYTIIEIK